MIWAECLWGWIADHATVLATVVGALAAAAVAYFTYTLKESTDKLWFVAVSQAKIAERTLTDLERPYIFIYRPSYERAASSADYPKLTYAVSNSGKFAARIETVRFRLGLKNIQGQFPGLIIDGDHPLLSEPILASNQERRDLDCVVPGHLLYYDPPARMLKDQTIFGIVITYRGPFTKGHETAQCWRYDKSLNGFVEISDPQYTYMR